MAGGQVVFRSVVTAGESVYSNICVVEMCFPAEVLTFLSTYNLFTVVTYLLALMRQPARAESSRFSDVIYVYLP